MHLLLKVLHYSHDYLHSCIKDNICGTWKYMSVGRKDRRGKKEKKEKRVCGTLKGNSLSPKRIQLKGRNEQQSLDLSTELLTVKSRV